MLVFKDRDILDMNKPGLVFVSILMGYALVLTNHIIIFILSELLLLIIGLWILAQTKTTYAMKIMVNDQGQWIVRKNNFNYDVVVNDYWKIGGSLLIWLKGPEKSVSIRLSRSIIGADKFSQLLVIIQYYTLDTTNE